MLLEGKKGLVLNVTNKNSIGWGIVEALHAQGAHVGVGAQNDKMLERVNKLIDGKERMSTFVIDFSDEEAMSQLGETVKKEFGEIDFFVHSAAFANKEDLEGRFVDTSRDGFKTALDISAFSLVACCKALEQVLKEDSSVVTISYLGSTRAVGNYNVMGVAKAALEACVRYLAVDLGPKGIRVNTLSPGPVNTISARGVKGLLEMLNEVGEKAPLKRPYGQEECGLSAVYLCSDLSKGVSGQIIFIDSGYNIMGL